MTNETQRVTQVDRDAAEAFCQLNMLTGPTWRERVARFLARHRQSSSNAGGVDVEQAAWDWLSEKFLNIEAGHDPADRDYSADEMVDAFIAGAAVSRPLYSSEDVERVATAIRDVKQGLGFDYMDFCRDAARAALASLSTPTAESISEPTRRMEKTLGAKFVPTPDRIGKDAVREALIDRATSLESQAKERPFNSSMLTYAATELRKIAALNPAQATPSALSGDAGEGRFQKYLADETNARARLATFPDTVRQRLINWQEGQSEWFSDTLLEIVAEFIAFDDASRAGEAENKAGGLWYRRWHTAQTRVNELEALIANPPKHKFWGAGEPDCPREIKAPNGELHTLRCKACDMDNPSDDICRAALPSHQGAGE